MVAGLLFTYGLIAVVLVVNALRSPKPPTHRLPPLWLPAMIASEAAGLWLVVVAAVTALGLAAHAWNQQLGRLGIVLLILAFSGQVAVWLRSHLGARRVGPGARHGGPLWRRLLNRPPRPADDLEFETRELAPHPHRREPLQMDLYRRVGIGRPSGTHHLRPRGRVERWPPPPGRPITAPAPGTLRLGGGGHRVPAVTRRHLPRAPGRNRRRPGLGGID